VVTYIYRPQAAIDANGELVTAGSGQVFAAPTGGSPLTVRNSAGLNVTTIAVSSIGQTELFEIDDYPELYWRSGNYVVHIFSISSMRTATETASAAASAAQLAAETAASAAQTLANAAVKSVNGLTPDESGNVNVSGGSTGGVLSVLGKTPDGAGNVVITLADIGAAATGHTHTFASKDGLTGVTGTPTSSTFLRGDGVWAAPPSGGGGGGTVTSVNGQTPDAGGNVGLSKSHLGLGAVDNTSDLNKPLSTATINALADKANTNAVVLLTGNQSVAGVKTFTSAPVVPDNSFALEKVTGLLAALSAKVTGLNGITGIWKGSQTAFDALGAYDNSVVYLVTGA
jgi:hypothetical protein